MMYHLLVKMALSLSVLWLGSCSARMNHRSLPKARNRVSKPPLARRIFNLPSPSRRCDGAHWQYHCNVEEQGWRANRRILPQQQQHQQCRTLAFAESPLLSSESTLWVLRGISAMASYVGIVAYVDRPRGRVGVGSREVDVRQSTVPGAGLGLFAATDLERGTVLGTYPGVVLPLSQNLPKLRDFPACEGYIWRFSDNKFVIDPTNAVGTLESDCVGGNPSMPGSLWLFTNLLEMSTPTTLCRINEPPIGLDVNVVTNEDLQGRTVTFALERDVAKGEELFIDYGLYYDRSLYGKVPEAGEHFKQ